MLATRLGLYSRRAPVKVCLRAFTTTKPARFDIPFLPQIPQPPGNIVGTVNDPYQPPAPNKTHGSRHWTIERIVTIPMIPLIITPFVAGTMNPVVDGLINTLLIFHCYAGFESCIIDYVPSRTYGKYHDYAMGLLAGASALAAFGVYRIEATEEEGMYGVFKRVWQVGKKPKEVKEAAA